MYVELLTTSPSAGWPPDKTDDWAMFFVNMFIFLLVHIINLFTNQKTSIDLWIGLCICTKRGKGYSLAKSKTLGTWRSPTPKMLKEFSNPNLFGTYLTT